VNDESAAVIARLREFHRLCIATRVAEDALSSDQYGLWALSGAERKVTLRALSHYRRRLARLTKVVHCDLDAVGCHLEQLEHDIEPGLVDSVLETAIGIYEGQA
jgi:hypothetical protein